MSPLAFSLVIKSVATVCFKNIRYALKEVRTGLAELNAENELKYERNE